MSPRTEEILEWIVCALLAVLLAVLSIAAGGCQASVNIVGPGQPVRLAQDAGGLHVATYAGRDAAGKPIWAVQPNTVTAPAGWYVVPPPTTRPE